MPIRLIGLVLVLALSLIAAPLAAEAQQAGKVPRIGILSLGSPPPPSSPDASAFVERLRELGYVEGQNIVIEQRWAEGKIDRLPELATDLVRIKVDIIVTGGVAAVRAAQRATGSIPIVMSATTDPLGAGLITSLARPGANVTGSATLASELGAKRLELLKEAFPKISRVGVLYDPTTSPSVLREVEGAAERLKVRLRVLRARDAEELESSFAEAKRAQVDKGPVEGTAVLSTPASPGRFSRSAPRYRIEGNRTQRRAKFCRK